MAAKTVSEVSYSYYTGSSQAESSVADEYTYAYTDSDGSRPPKPRFGPGTSSSSGPFATTSADTSGQESRDKYARRRGSDDSLDTADIGYTKKKDSSSSSNSYESFEMSRTENAFKTTTTGVKTQHSSSSADYEYEYLTVSSNQTKKSGSNSSSNPGAQKTASRSASMYKSSNASKSSISKSQTASKSKNASQSASLGHPNSSTSKSISHGAKSSTSSSSRPNFTSAAQSGVRSVSVSSNFRGGSASYSSAAQKSSDRAPIGGGMDRSIGGGTDRSIGGGMDRSMVKPSTANQSHARTHSSVGDSTDDRHFKDGDFVVTDHAWQLKVRDQKTQRRLNAVGVGESPNLPDPNKAGVYVLKDFYNDPHFRNTPGDGPSSIAGTTKTSKTGTQERYTIPVPTKSRVPTYRASDVSADQQLQEFRKMVRYQEAPKSARQKFLDEQEYRRQAKVENQEMFDYHHKLGASPDDSDSEDVQLTEKDILMQMNMMNVGHPLKKTDYGYQKYERALRENDYRPKPRITLPSVNDLRQYSDNEINPQRDDHQSGFQSKKSISNQKSESSSQPQGEERPVSDQGSGTLGKDSKPSSRQERKHKSGNSESRQDSGFSEKKQDSGYMSGRPHSSYKDRKQGTGEYGTGLSHQFSTRQSLKQKDSHRTVDTGKRSGKSDMNQSVRHSSQKRRSDRDRSDMNQSVRHSSQKRRSDRDRSDREYDRRDRSDREYDRRDRSIREYDDRKRSDYYNRPPPDYSDDYHYYNTSRSHYAPLQSAHRAQDPIPRDSGYPPGDRRHESRRESSRYYDRSYHSEKQYRRDMRAAQYTKKKIPVTEEKKVDESVEESGEQEQIIEENPQDDNVNNGEENVDENELKCDDAGDAAAGPVKDTIIISESHTSIPDKAMVLAPRNMDSQVGKVHRNLKWADQNPESTESHESLSTSSREMKKIHRPRKVTVKHPPRILKASEYTGRPGDNTYRTGQTAATRQTGRTGRTRRTERTRRTQRTGDGSQYYSDGSWYSDYDYPYSDYSYGYDDEDDNEYFPFNSLDGKPTPIADHIEGPYVHLLAEGGAMGSSWNPFTAMHDPLNADLHPLQYLRKARLDALNGTQSYAMPPPLTSRIERPPVRQIHPELARRLAVGLVAVECNRNLYGTDMLMTPMPASWGLGGGRHQIYENPGLLGNLGCHHVEHNEQHTRAHSAPPDNRGTWLAGPESVYSGSQGYYSQNGSHTHDDRRTRRTTRTRTGDVTKSGRTYNHRYSQNTGRISSRPPDGTFPQGEMIQNSFRSGSPNRLDPSYSPQHYTRSTRAYSRSRSPTNGTHTSGQILSTGTSRSQMNRSGRSRREDRSDNQTNRSSHLVTKSGKRISTYGKDNASSRGKESYASSRSKVPPSTHSFANPNMVGGSRRDSDVGWFSQGDDMTHSSGGTPFLPGNKSQRSKPNGTPYNHSYNNRSSVQLDERVPTVSIPIPTSMSRVASSMNQSQNLSGIIPRGSVMSGMNAIGPTGEPYSLTAHEIALGKSLSNPEVSWDEIFGYEEVKNAIKQFFFEQDGFSAKAFLIYGPIGVGKTLLCQALGHEVGPSFFAISAARLGTVEKAVNVLSTLFSLALKEAPSVMFIDDLDHLFGHREQWEMQDANAIIETFVNGMRLIENADVQFLGVTNVPYNIQPSVLQQFSESLYVELPNEDQRMAIMQRFLEMRGASWEVNSLPIVVSQTEGYSCRDLIAMVMSAYDAVIKNASGQVVITMPFFSEALRVNRPSSNMFIQNKLEDWQRTAYWRIGKRADE